MAAIKQIAENINTRRNNAHNESVLFCPNKKTNDNTIRQIATLTTNLFLFLSFI